MPSPGRSWTAASAVRAQTALAVESARAALARRRRLADGLPLERALYAYIAATFRAQLTALADSLDADPVDPAGNHAEETLADRFAIVADGTRDAFTVGMAEATMAGMAWGWQRFRESIPELPATEAVAYVPPPKPWGDPADIEHEMAWHGNSVRRVASLRDSPFALANPAAEGAARRHAATLVKGIDATTRDQMRRIIASGRSSGLSSEKLAGVIRRAGYPTSYLPFDTPSPLRHIRDRAHLIAVTETAYAYEKGQLEGVRAARNAGLVMVKQWLTVGDGAVDAACSFNEVQGEIPSQDAFSTGDTEPPAHPGCRCTVAYRALSSAELGMENPYAPGGAIDQYLKPPAAPTTAGRFVPHGENALKFGSRTPGGFSQSKLTQWATRAMRGDAEGAKLRTRVLDSFRNYSGSFYTRLNSYCRGLSGAARQADLDEAVRLMDSGMVPLKGTRPVQMWRGVASSTVERLAGTDIASIRAGTVFTDDAFMSASGNIEVAENFGPVIFDLRIPPGTRARYMGYTPNYGPTVSNLPGEAETLIERGCTIVARGDAQRIPSPSGGYREVWLIRADVYPPAAKPAFPPV